MRRPRRGFLLGRLDSGMALKGCPPQGCAHRHTELNAALGACLAAGRACDGVTRMPFAEMKQAPRCPGGAFHRLRCLRLPLLPSSCVRSSTKISCVAIPSTVSGSVSRTTPSSAQIHMYASEAPPRNSWGFPSVLLRMMMEVVTVIMAMIMPWALLAALGMLFCTLFGALGALLGRSWGLLGPLGALLGRSRGVLGVLWPSFANFNENPAPKIDV